MFNFLNIQSNSGLRRRSYIKILVVIKIFIQK